MQKTIAGLESQLAESAATVDTVNSKLTSRTISEALREAARESHVLPAALPDLLSLGALELKLADDGTVDAAAWIEQRKNVSPYWWPVARGAGAHGSSDDGGIATGNNPFEAGATFSLTRQGEIMQRDPNRARMLQAAAARA
jgi:hypothetical protein